MSKYFKQKNGGFTLIETLVAVSIFTVSILGLFAVLTEGISSTIYARQKIIASYLAQEGIEYVRNIRDTYVLYYDDTSQEGWDRFKVVMNPCNATNGCGFDTVFPHDVFVCGGSNNCRLSISDGSYSTNSGDDSGFIRQVWMTTTESNLNEVRIFSKVEWTQGSGSYNITFSENLFNWVE